MTVSGETLRSISTPERVDSRLGALEFVDGVPSRETSELVYDHLDFVHALNVFLNGFPGASTQALRNGLHEVGVEDNAILIFSELMGSESLFLTANADTVYFLGIVDLTFGSDGYRDASAGARAVRRHVVSVDRRLRPAGPGSRRGRPVPARRAGLRRLAARQRLPRPALAHDEGDPARPLIHQREPGPGPRSDRRADQEHDQALPLCPGRLRDEHRDAARGPRAPANRRRTFPRRSSSRAAGSRSTRSRRATSASSSC